MQLLRESPSWVLENLEKFEEFKVGWNNYGRIKIQCDKCLKFNDRRNSTCKYCKKSIKNFKTHTFGVGKPPKEAVL